MTAERIATSLGGRRAGEGWLARCPAHDDQRPSLSIAESTDGRVLVCCQAGCEQRRVIDSLRALGLWSGGDKACRDFSTDKTRRMDTTINQQFDADRTERALRIWRSSGEARGTLVERYLQSRGIEIIPPPSLRFHNALNHPSRAPWPAMVAIVARGQDNSPLGIHRTFLARDGVGKALIEPTRMISMDPCVITYPMRSLP
jgi:putative DNA primase/helicase